MKSKSIRFDLVVFGAAVFAVAYLTTACSDPGSPETGSISIQNRVEVYGSSTAPPLDDPQDEIWDNALTGSILLGEDDYPGEFDLPTKCFLKAIVTADRFFLRAEWRDITRSIWPNLIISTVDSIIYDTISVDPLQIDTSYEYVWLRRPTFVGDTWYDQDRFAVMWDMGDNGGEGADCMTMCHAEGHPTSGHRMYTTGGGHVDVWQWLSAMSDPLLLARDEYWGGEGRATDEGDSLVISNYDFFKSEPFYAHPEGTGKVNPFLFSDDIMEFDSSLNWPSGYQMPGYILQKSAGGSRVDIIGFSNFGKNTGRWVALLSRPLSTGHPDDIDLSQVTPGDSVMVSIAVMDNADRLHSGSKPFYIIFPR